MCQYVDCQNLTPGWACCACKRAIGSGIYNNMTRIACKNCEAAPCVPLTPDPITGRRYENRQFNREPPS